MYFILERMIYMSRKNIFEVLQSIAEDSEFNERFLAILREYGYEGTLEEAEETLKKQTQVVLNNLTTEDLQNVAGGRFLMNGKLKKALAVGGASLMAGGVVLPHGKAANLGKAAYDYTKENPIHTGLTGALGLTTMLLIADKVLGGKSTSNLPFKDELYAFLEQMDLSEKKSACRFVKNLSEDETKIKLTENKQQENSVQLSIQELAGIKEEENEDEIVKTPEEYTGYTLLLALIKLMDKKNTYVNKEEYLTEQGALVLNHLAKYIIDKVNQAIINHDQEVMKAKKAFEECAKELRTAENKLSTAQKEDDQYKEKLENYRKFVGEINKQITDIVQQLNELRAPAKAEAKEQFMKNYTNDGKKTSEAMRIFTELRNKYQLASDKAVGDNVLKDIDNTLTTELEKISKLENSKSIEGNINTINQKIDEKFGKLIEYNNITSDNLKRLKEEKRNAEKIYQNQQTTLNNATKNAEKNVLKPPSKKFGTDTKLLAEKTNTGR